MKAYTFIIITFFSIHLAYSQSSIKGKIVDEKNQPLEAVVISLINTTNKKLFKAALSNDKGFFSLEKIKNGTYQIKITSLGLKEVVRTIDLNQSIDLGTIIMQFETENLDEVVIKTEKPMVQVLADKTVFNIQNTINAAGDSGFDLLRKAPGIIVDNNDNVIVEGKTGVLFYIDGRPSVLRGQDLTNFLKALQSSDIDYIEIITQPSSKYDAEGNAGIINIVLKRDRSLGMNGTLGSGFTYGRFARYNNSVSFNNRNKRTSFYGTLSNRVGNTFGFINLFRRQNNTIFDAQTETKSYNNSNNARFGFDYYANKKSTFGILVSGNFNNGNSDSNSKTPIIPSGNTNPTQVLVAGSDTNSDVSNLFGNLNYKFNNKKGTTLNIDVDFGNYTSDRNNLQPNQYFNGTETTILSEVINFMITPIEINLFTSKIDYEQNLWKGKLGMGLKFSKVNTENQFDFFDRINEVDVINLDKSNNFIYDEQITAAYLNYKRKFKKFGFQTGIRVERTKSDGILTSDQANNDNRVKRDYINWFPSGGITYQVNKVNALALIYSKRIQRPNYQSLNPFEFKIDELSFRKGNPFLQPQYTDNIRLSHTYKYKLTTSISYSFIRDFSAQITEAVGSNQNFLTQRNVANQKVINLGVSYPTRFNKWWNVYVSLNANRNIFEATNPDFNPVSQNVVSLYAQNTFKLPNNFRLEVSGWYNSPSIWGGTYKIKSIGSLNLAVQKKIMNNKMTLRLAVNDVLFTSQWKGDTRFGNLAIIGNGGSDSRQFRINLTYNFGRNEIKKARKRKTGLEDEKNRIGR